MYLNHFGLREFQFGITPDTSFIYSADAHQEALNTLLIGLDTGEGFIKITGEVGTGKTLLCRRFLATLSEDHVVAYIPNPMLEPHLLLIAIAEELRLIRSPRHRKCRGLRFSCLGIKTPAGVHTARETPACAGGEGEDHAGIFRRFFRHQSCTSRTRRTGILPASLHCETAARVTPRALRRSSVSRKTVGMRSSTFMARGCVTRPSVSSVLRVTENNL